MRNLKKIVREREREKESKNIVPFYRKGSNVAVDVAAINSDYNFIIPDYR